jgi:hypothetical protein
MHGGWGGAARVPAMADNSASKKILKIACYSIAHYLYFFTWTANKQTDPMQNVVHYTIAN